MISLEIGSIKVWALFLLLVAVSYMLAFLWVRILPGKKYQLIIFPGVVIHEVSHLLGCLLSGARIKEFKLFSFEGGYVKHSKPKIPIIGNLIISFAPILGGIAFLSIASKSLNLPFESVTILTGSLYVDFLSLTKDVLSFFSTNWGGWKMWFFLYLSISVIISLVPSRQDLKNSFWSIASLIILFITLGHFNFLPEFSGKPVLLLTGVLAATVFVGIAALALSLPIYAIKKMI